MEEHLPLDSPLGGVYRVGGALTGLVLLVFAILGFLTGPEFITTEGKEVLFLRTNGLLNLISVVFGLILLAAAVIGRNVAAVTNTVIGSVLVASGLINLTLLRTEANFLSFRMSNVIFSFVLGVVVLTFGLYGRVSAGDPADGGSVPATTDSGSLEAVALAVD